jgi:O-antigen ligase
MLQITKKFHSIPATVSLGIIFTSLLPLFILMGSAINNLSIIIIDVLFLINLKKKELKIKNKNLLLFITFFFYISLIFNIFLNSGDKFIFDRQIGLIRFIILAFAISFFLSFKKKMFFNFIYSIWALIFFIVSLDVLFEYFTGFNLTGNRSWMDGRISSFLGEELKIGNYYYAFALIIIPFIVSSYKNNLKNIILISIILIISFIIGERSNFIKTFIGISIFLLFLQSINYKKKIFIFIIFFVSCFYFFHTNKAINIRINTQVIKPIVNSNVFNYIMSSQYGAHYFTAYQIFQDNKYFGVGLKQFRYESQKKKYKPHKLNKHKLKGFSTHPHQIHFEFLSETGLFGYMAFVLFMLTTLIYSIKKYLKSYNPYLLGSILFLFTSFIPIIPSGSFFTTYSATFFWISYGIILKFVSNNE